MNLSLQWTVSTTVGPIRLYPIEVEVMITNKRNMASPLTVTYLAKVNIKR